MDLKVSDNEDVRVVVQRRLSSLNAGNGIMVVDNADDETVLLGDDTAQAISTFLPSSDKGRILYTTSNQQVALNLQCSETVQIDQMNFEEGLFLLRKSAVGRTLASNDPAVGELLEKLTYLPLAISQAGAFMAKNKTNPAEYLELLQATAEDEIYLLSRAFPDKHRYDTSNNAVATTWLVSFNQIREKHPQASELLLAMSFYEHKAIPWSLLPPLVLASQMVDAIGTLEAYAFLSVNEGKTLTEAGHKDDLLDMHRLVHLAAKIWRQNLQDDVH
ncbi:NB-ARC domain-containing protein [Elsinoe australis]|uniref:NB-ARC domain-containing protein n=1 Tax=Elsinoe australis TaxID=40998 RepID=A0A4U7AZV3_9PEZI|nr:NB-ARC domain-containing protein [Elsinoe australis]